MSQENVEVVQDLISAINDRDLDRYLAHCTEDIRLETPWTAVEGVYEVPMPSGGSSPTSATPLPTSSS